MGSESCIRDRPLIVSGDWNNLKYLLVPFKNTVSTFSIAPFAVELVENPAKVPWYSVENFNCEGSPLIASTVTCFPRIHLASEGEIVLSNGLSIITCFPNNTLNKISNDKSVPLDV